MVVDKSLFEQSGVRIPRHFFHRPDFPENASSVPALWRERGQDTQWILCSMDRVGLSIL
jgi:hypothetical protein